MVHGYRIDMAFAVEAILDEATLYRRIHRNHFDAKTGKVASAAFKQERMSVNWDKYSTPEQTADANSSAVVAIVAGACRKLEQTVEHAPVEADQPGGPNQAHAEVCGKKTSPISHQLRDLASLVWLKPSES